MQNSHTRRSGRPGERRARRSGPSEESQGDSALGADVLESQNLDLNHATLAQLCAVDGLTDELAEVILERRVKQGHYTSWDELAELPGMDEEKLRALARAARLSGPVSAH
jgi:DNA uptake protein ComE-like DNA-binding protein